MPFADSFTQYTAIGAVVAILLFLLFRELFCWYWKVNKCVALLKEVRDLLAKERHSANPTPGPTNGVAQ